MMTEFLDVCYDAIKKQEQAIPNTIDVVDETAASVLENKKQIVLIGCGDSYAASDYGRWAFLRVGLNALVVSPDEIDYLHLDKDTVVIGVTASGRSLATIDALQKAKAQGATVVVLTDNEDGIASQDADHVWVTKSGVGTYNTSPSAPTTAAMVYLLTISSKLDDESKDDLNQDIKQLKRIGKEMLAWAEKEGIVISGLTSPNVPIYLISEGPNHVAAQVGMMKFDEYSILKGIAAIREEFRHHYNISIRDGESAVLITRSPVDSSDDVYMGVLTDSLRMMAHHLHVDEKLGLKLALVQTIPNTIALQMAAYHTVLKFNPNKESFKIPHAEAFKIY
jgi:glucosamine 6-phosphate synthetase-like amidotransferase/phosphosugar isomerase protein